MQTESFYIRKHRKLIFNINDMIFPMIRHHEFYGYSHSEHTGTKYSYTAKVYESRCQDHRKQQNVVAAGIWIILVSKYKK